MRRYTVLAAALVLASLGAAGAEEKPLSERLMDKLEERIDRPEADERRLQELKAKVIRARAVSQGFHCGRDFISLPAKDNLSFAWTVRKSDIQNLFWLRGGNHIAVVVKRVGKEPFEVKVVAHFRQLVTECLD